MPAEIPRVKIGKRGSGLAGLIIVAGAFVAYANTFHAPFTFDDVSSILDNPTIRQLWPPGRALSPPPDWGMTVSGRPVLNLSLAINYAISGFNVWSYHALNLVVHALAGLTLFGLVRRTLRHPPLAGQFAGQGTPLALVVAAIWTLHPLQTEAVTYVIQRAESLMGLFFLVTLYAFVRAMESPRPWLWWTAAVTTCLLGVGTKEIAALIPIVALLYDRTFVSGSFKEAWRRHRWPLLALAATWLPLLWLLAGTGGDRGGTVRFDVGSLWVRYGLTQFEAITRYVGLAFWPHPLVFDYGKIVTPGLPAALPWAIPVLALLGATVIALWRWPVAGFLGAWFFVILAPTSIVPGTLQMIVEHRMYLPLAAIIALVICGGAIWLGSRIAVTIGVILAIATAAGTWRRNTVYRSEQSLWEDTVGHRPGSARAENNLGLAYYHLGRFDEAIARFRESLRLDPSVANTHYNLGLALMNSGHLAEAVAPLEETVRILPYYFYAEQNLGIVLTKLGRPQEALAHFETALRFDPSPAETHFHFGVALAELGRWAEAADHYAQAVRINPRYAEAQSNWGVALFRLNASAAAVGHLDEALRLNPDSADVHFNLGLALAALGRAADAVAHYAEAVRLDPAHAEAQLNLGVALGQMGRLPEAIAHLEQAARLRPEWPEAHTNLATALSQAGRSAEALTHYEAALRLRPDSAQAHYNVGYALLVSGRNPEARQQFESALKIQPDLVAAREMLRRLRQAESLAP